MPFSRIGSRVRSRRNGRSLQVSDGRENTSRKVSTAARGSPDRRFSRKRARVALRHADEGAHRRRGDARLRAGRRSRHPLGDEATEHRIARVLRDAHALDEGQEAAVEVAGPPAEHARVEGDDDRLGTARLRSRDEALDEFVVARPVELEPAGTRVLCGDPLHRERRLARDDAGESEGSGRPGDREVGIRVDELEHADGRDDDREGVAAPEELDREVARRDVPQHPRHQAPRVEGVVVGLRRGLPPRRSGDVRPRLRGHRPFGGGDEIRPAGGDPRPGTGCARAVDVGLPGSARCRGDAVVRHGVPFRRWIRPARAPPATCARGSR